MAAVIFKFDELSLMPVAKFKAMGVETLILPSAAEVEKFAPPTQPEDEFFTYDHRGFPCVAKPVGISETLGW